ncbi:MAG TPA: zinc dependent phospholipase C family protein, partial [Chloroflexota bacterium]|nr:zinc dependent phospholipase C family protein [Chloroflexota bacterium]
MPRLRCHWALLAHARAALLDSDSSLAALLRDHRAEFYAGGVAPDALRIFHGADKASTHFYDDQRRETWPHVVASLTAAHPVVADPTALGPSSRAWMAGYVAHIAADVAYWDNILPHLPPFPQRAPLHHGAWLIADDVAIPDGERDVDPDGVDYAAAPPWVDESAVRRMLARLRGRILVDGMWTVELAYVRARPEAAGKSDDELLAEHLPGWEVGLAEARQ